MKLSNENKIKIIWQFVIAVIMISTAIIGYLPEPQYVTELTFFSNILIGFVFLTSGIRSLLQKKEFPNLVYSCSLVTILLVFLICMGSLTGIYFFNFSGAFLFLHVINPLAVLAYYLFYINEKSHGRKTDVIFMPFIAIFYLLIDYIAGKISGSFRYGFFEPQELNIGGAFIVGLSIYLFLLLVGYIIFKLNSLLHTKR